MVGSVGASSEPARLPPQPRATRWIRLPSWADRRRGPGSGACRAGRRLTQPRIEVSAPRAKGAGAPGRPPAAPWRPRRVCGGPGAVHDQGRLPRPSAASPPPCAAWSASRESTPGRQVAAARDASSGGCTGSPPPIRRKRLRLRIPVRPPTTPAASVNPSRRESAAACLLARPWLRHGAFAHQPDARTRSLDEAHPCREDGAAQVLRPGSGLNDAIQIGGE